MAEELRNQIRAKETELNELSEKLANLNNKLYSVILKFYSRPN